MRHELPPLPYDMNALAPYISAETLEYHYGKHHRKYVDTLNELMKDTEYRGMPLEQIITRAGSGPIFNNAAQVWNHTFYWNSMSPAGGAPSGALARAIDASFGSSDQFKSQFGQQVDALFGSGWVWLVKDAAGKLSIEQTKDADNPLTSGRTPVLTCDAWEHAFYIDYRNDKKGYIEAFWKVVNWEFAGWNYRG